MGFHPPVLHKGFPDVVYVFKHALPQEVAYNSLLIERRKTLHQHTAHATEQVFHNELEDHYPALVHHYSSSGNTEKAIQYLLKDLRSAWFDATQHEFESAT
jgi:predicted ATPase